MGDVGSGRGGSTLKKTQAIMDQIIRYNKFTLGNFLTTLLNSTITGGEWRLETGWW
ncbi:hypothetical protein RSAG8_13632, partial [Rhizoctonia solani AG-8 WAC10335]